MVGKTFKGLTDALLRWQTEHFPTIETRRTAARRARAPGHRRRDRHRRRAALDAATRAAIALRFARVKRYRHDKRPDEADTIQTLREMLRG